MTAPSQGVAVLAYLRDRGPAGITALEALDRLGVLRLAPRIQELREQGYDIETQTLTVRSRKRVARYVLHEQSVPGLSAGQTAMNLR